MIVFYEACFLIKVEADSFLCEYKEIIYRFSSVFVITSHRLTFIWESMTNWDYLEDRTGL